MGTDKYQDCHFQVFTAFLSHRDDFREKHRLHRNTVEPLSTSPALPGLRFARGLGTSRTSTFMHLLALSQTSAASQQDLFMQDPHQGSIPTGVYLKTISLPV